MRRTYISFKPCAMLQMTWTNVWNHTEAFDFRQKRPEWCEGPEYPFWEEDDAWCSPKQWGQLSSTSTISERQGQRMQHHQRPPNENRGRQSLLFWGLFSLMWAFPWKEPSMDIPRTNLKRPPSLHLQHGQGKHEISFGNDCCMSTMVRT